MLLLTKILFRSARSDFTLCALIKTQLQVIRNINQKEKSLISIFRYEELAELLAF